MDLSWFGRRPAARPSGPNLQQRQSCAPNIHTHTLSSCRCLVADYLVTRKGPSKEFGETLTRRKTTSLSLARSLFREHLF